MNKLCPRLWPLAAAIALLAPGAHADDRLDLVFVEPDRFTDFGRGAFDIERTQRTLQLHLEQLARRHLPPGRSLRLEVLDIDRVGALGPRGRGVDLVRVVRSPAEWPRIHLRYTLRDGDQVLAQGDEWLQQMDFLRLLARDGGDELAVEKRMLDRWFAELAATPSPG